MLTKNKLKELSRYRYKKYRDADGVFIVEGTKSVLEVLRANCEIVSLIALESWIQKHTSVVQEDFVVTTNLDYLKKLSLLHTPQEVWALVKKKNEQQDASHSSITLMLDGIQNPGNMGTILRIVDWFGFSTVMCSPDCVDVYNPKVVQASMGAVLRTHVMYLDLCDVLSKSTQPVFGTFLEGSTIYTESLPSKAYVVLGNEGTGISPEVAQYVTNSLSIPSGASISEGSESLNVAVAAGIVCSEFFRQSFF
ncbi:MAG: RNA methyltransferase [Bacteroidales bacterium]